MQHSDVLITDASSRAFNYMLLDKPVILVSSPSFVDAVDIDRANLMRGASLVADDPSKLEGLITRADRDPDLLRTERREVAEACFVNFGKATDVVTDLIKARLTER